MMRGFNRKDFAEVIGTAAIVASLLFVGLQMRQAQNIAIAEQYQNRGISFREFVSSLLDNESVIRVWAEQVESRYESGNGDDAFKDSYEAYGAEYVTEQRWLHRSMLVVLDSYYLGYQLGTMTEESWLAYQKRLKLGLRDPQFRSVYSDEREYLPESFQLLCNVLIREIESEAESLD